MTTDEAGEYKLPRNLIDKEELKEEEEEAPKNEQKPPLFIFMKHLIKDMNPDNTSRIERYVNNYCGITNTKDKEDVRQMFNDRVKELSK